MDCYEENLVCHDALERITATQSSSWQTIALSVAGGFVAGMIVAQQIRH